MPKMKKGEIRKQTDREKLVHFAKLVAAMRSAQRRLQYYDDYLNNQRKEEIQRSADSFADCVDYMTNRILQ